MEIGKLGERIDKAAYGLAGLCICSELPLPGVPGWAGEISARNKIVIRRAEVPRSLSTVTAVFPDGQCNKNEFLLDIKDVSRYLVRGGEEILVDQATGSRTDEVCAFLLGTAFGVLCHQRGIVPLHASGVDAADGCIAFVGKTGAGKSTLIAALAARGHPVISDDVFFFKPGERQQVTAWPGINRLRLWEDAVTALGLDQRGRERELRRFNKYIIPLRPPPNYKEPRRLRRVYQLDTGPNGDRASVRQLQGAAAVEVLIQNIYRSGLAEHMGRKPELFVACATAARDVPVFQFSRPLRFHALPDSVDVLEDHLSRLQ